MGWVSSKQTKDYDDVTSIPVFTEASRGSVQTCHIDRTSLVFKFCFPLPQKIPGLHLTYICTQLTVHVPLLSCPEDIMSAESQIFIHHQLLESTAAILKIVASFGSTEAAIIHSLGEGLKSLQDTLLGYGNMPTPALYPLYKLCLHLWQNFDKQLQQSLGNASELARISVVGYDICRLRKVLLSISHALCTYLNLIRWYVNTLITETSMLNKRLVPQQM